MHASPNLAALRCAALRCAAQRLTRPLFNYNQATTWTILFVQLIKSAHLISIPVSRLKGGVITTWLHTPSGAACFRDSMAPPSLHRVGRLGIKPLSNSKTIFVFDQLDNLKIESVARMTLTVRRRDFQKSMLACRRNTIVCRLKVAAACIRPYFGGLIDWCFTARQHKSDAENFSVHLVVAYVAF